MTKVITGQEMETCHPGAVLCDLSHSESTDEKKNHMVWRRVAVTPLQVPLSPEFTPGNYSLEAWSLSNVLHWYEDTHLKPNIMPSDTHNRQGSGSSNAPYGFTVEKLFPTLTPADTHIAGGGLNSSNFNHYFYPHQLSK